jgi:hypothetical protein
VPVPDVEERVARIEAEQLDVLHGRREEELGVAMGDEVP